MERSAAPASSKQKLSPAKPPSLHHWLRLPAQLRQSRFHRRSQSQSKSKMQTSAEFRIAHPAPSQLSWRRLSQATCRRIHYAPHALLRAGSYQNPAPPRLPEAANATLSWPTPRTDSGTTIQTPARWPEPKAEKPIRSRQTPAPTETILSGS